MKVLQINTCGNVGTGRIACDLYRTLKANEYEGTVAFARNTIAADVPHIKFGNMFNVYMDGILTRITDKAGFYSKAATKKLIIEIKKYNPDIIHLHNLHGYYINIEILFKFLKEFNKPVVWTLHDCWAFTGHCCHYTVAKCSKWQTGCFNCPQKNMYPISFLKDNSKWNYEKKKELFTSLSKLHLVPVSDWLSEEVGKSFLKDIPRTVIKNGIDLSIFKQTESDFRKKYNLQDKFIILGVANSWMPSKGLKDFIELSKMVDESYQVVVVGVTKKQKAELPENVIGLMRTDSVTELAGLYSTADVYFSASVEETFGLTLAEAIACGTPIIAYNSTALPEVVSNSVDIIVEKNDIESVFKKIEKIRINEKKEVLDRKVYDKNICFEQYMALYRRIVS